MVKAMLAIESGDESPEEVDVDQKLLSIANSETLHFFRSYSESRVQTYEIAKTNVFLTSEELAEAYNTYLKIQKQLESNRQNRKEEINQSIEETKNNVIGVIQSVKETKELYENVIKRLTPYEKLPDFSSIKLSLDKYDDSMVELTETQSSNFCEHIFTIKNKTQHFFRNLKLYHSDSAESITSFSLHPNEEKTIREDYLAEAIKYHGKIFFQIFYCSFPLSKQVETYSIAITGIFPLEADKTRYEIRYQSHITACQSVQVVLNGTVIINNFKTKNYQTGSVAASITGYTGEVVIFFTFQGKIISNQLAINIIN